MMRLCAALLLLVAPAHAQAGPDQAWGRAVDGRPGPSELHLRRCEADCFAELTFVNRHLWGPALTRRFVLAIEGLEVGVTVADGAGTGPELLLVEPPPGFVADPPRIEVGEDAQGTVRLRPVPMS